MNRKGERRGLVRLLLMIDDAAVGGGQRHLLDLADHLDREIFEIGVACEATGYLATEIRDRGIPFFRVRLTNEPRLRGYRDCVGIMKQFEPALVHTHGGTAGFYGRLAARAHGTPAVHTYHGIHYLRGGGRLKRQIFRSIDRWLCRRTSWTICVSHADMELALEEGLVDPVRTAVIHNGIDVDRFNAAREVRISRRTTRDWTREPIIGTIGRLNPEKGHALLVQAAGIVMRRVPAARFLIVGEGRERIDLERRIRAGGWSERIDLPGPTADLIETLAAMDLFVLPSFWEGLPLALLEAMAAGLPIVATEVGGIPEVVGSSECARLVPPDNAEELAAEILRILGDPSEAIRMSERAGERVRAEFGLERMIRRTEEVYRKALESAEA